MSNYYIVTENMAEEIHSGWLTKSPGSKKVTIFANNITLPIRAVSSGIILCREPDVRFFLNSCDLPTRPTKSWSQNWRG